VEEKNKNIKYISWNYGKKSDGQYMHLIRLTNGLGLLRTTEECIKLGLIYVPFPEIYKYGL